CRTTSAAASIAALVWLPDALQTIASPVPSSKHRLAALMKIDQRRVMLARKDVPEELVGWKEDADAISQPLCCHMLRFLLLHLHRLTLTGSDSGSDSDAPMQVQGGQAPLLQLWTGSVDDDADFLVDELRVLLSVLTTLVVSDKGTRVACGKRAALEVSLSASSRNTFADR
ncbi:hypothetical protein OC834_008026, partial [Tilletia horrida]